MDMHMIFNHFTRYSYLLLAVFYERTFRYGVTWHKAEQYLNEDWVATTLDWWLFICGSWLFGKLGYCYYIYTDNIIAYIYINLMLKHLLKPMSIYFNSHLTFMSLVLRNGTGYCHWEINRKGVSWLKREINVSMISYLFAFIFCYIFPLSYKRH